MAAAMGIADRTAKTAVAALADARFIQILKSGKSNVYIINSQVAWQGARGARFAAFNAEIVLAEAEQMEPVDKLIEDARELMTVPHYSQASGLLWAMRRERHQINRSCICHEFHH